MARITWNQNNEEMARVYANKALQMIVTQETDAAVKRVRERCRDLLASVSIDIIQCVSNVSLSPELVIHFHAPGLEDKKEPA